MILLLLVVVAQIFEFVENIFHLLLSILIVLLMSDSHQINRFKDLLTRATIVNISVLDSHHAIQYIRHQ